MDPILDAIDEALKRKGLSDAAASKLAVGHPSLLKNLRMPREGEKRYNLPALMRLADVLDLEFYYGPKRELGPVEQTDGQDQEFAKVPLHEATLSAGPGFENESEVVVETMAFRREWLKRVGVAASAARLAKVSGDSMMPTLCSGDLVLIDTTKTPDSSGIISSTSRKPPIYAFVEDGEAKVKRVARVDSDLYAVMSDNIEYAPVFWRSDEMRSAHFIGKVVWWGHKSDI